MSVNAAASSTASSSGYSSTSRLTGLSGVDTEQMVKDLMKAESIPLTKLKKKKQLSEWQQAEYRDMTSLIKGFKDEFFDVTKPSSFMMSQSAYKKFTTTSSNSSVVTASASSAVSSGSHSIKVTKLAMAQINQSNTTLSKPLDGTAAMTEGAGSDVESISGKKINITLDGVTRELTFGTYTAGTLLDDGTAASFIGDFQDKVDTLFGVGKVAIGQTAGIIGVSTTGGASKIAISAGSSVDGIDNLKLTAGSSNRINISDTLETIAANTANGLSFDPVSNNAVIKINSSTFTFSKTTTLESMISQINSSTDAKLNVSYDEALDKLNFTSKDTGAGSTINISNTLSGSFFSNTLLGAGQDAEVNIDGQSITRSTNKITYNGIDYALLTASPATTETVTVTQDVDTVYNSIKSFVDKYNDLISKITTKITQKSNREYQPLTDEQKAGMSATEISSWETKGREGLLKSEPNLRRLLTDLRKTFYDQVKDVSGMVTDIGISTSQYYFENGKITIDETKLKDAIQNSPNKVMNLFSKQSTSEPTYLRSLSGTQISTRYQEEGLIHKLSDIIERNISTIRDTGNQKGYLIEKAGVLDDSSDYNSFISKQITAYNTQITTMIQKLSDKETAYYAKFSRMESIMQKMNAQSAQLTNSTGG